MIETYELKGFIDAVSTNPHAAYRLLSELLESVNDKKQRMAMENGERIDDI